MNVFELFATIRLNDREYNASLTNAEQRLKGFGRQAQQVGTQISTRISAPIAAIGGGIIATATQFQASMNRVQGITQATGDEFTALNELAKDLGETTQFSASQAADGMGFLAQAGFEVTEIMEALPGVLELAAAGQLSLAEAADLASNVLTGFGLQAEEVGRVNDVLAKAATSTNTNVRQLGEAFSFVAPVAAGLGVSVEEAGAAIGVLSNAGIQGSRAGTGLRRVLTTLVNESDKLGVSVTEADGTLRPFADIMEDLEATGLDTSDMLEIFGDRGGPAIATLLGEGSDAIRALEDDLNNAGGTAADLAETQMQGLPGAFRELRSAVEGAALALADAGLADFVENVADRITNLTRSFSDLDEGMQRIVLLVGGGAVAAGPLLIGFGLLTQAAGAAITAFRTLRTAAVFLAGPQGILVALGALLTGVLIKAFMDLNTEVSDAERQAEDFRIKMGDVRDTIGDNTNKDSLYGKVDNLARFISDENRNGWKEYATQAIENAESVEEAEQLLTDSIKAEIMEREMAALESARRNAERDFTQFAPEEAQPLVEQLEEAERDLQNLRRQFGIILNDDAVDPALRNAAREAIANTEQEISDLRDRLAREFNIGTTLADQLVGRVSEINLINEDIAQLTAELNAAAEAVQTATGGTPDAPAETPAVPTADAAGADTADELEKRIDSARRYGAAMESLRRIQDSFASAERGIVDRLVESRQGTLDYTQSLDDLRNMGAEAYRGQQILNDVYARSPEGIAEANRETSNFSNTLLQLTYAGAEVAQQQKALRETIAITDEQMKTIRENGLQQFVSGMTDLIVQAQNTEATVGEAFALMALRVVDSILQQIIALQVRLIAEKLFAAGTLNFLKLGAAVAASIAIKGLANNLKNQIQSRETASAPASSGVPSSSVGASSPAAGAVIDRLDVSVERFGNYVDRLVTEGIQVQLTGGGSGTAVLRGT